MTDLRTAAQQALEALEVATNCLDGYYIPRGKSTLPEIEDAITALKAALVEPEPCQYPDCVDNGPEGKCTRWLLAECSKSEDYKPKRPAEPVQEPQGCDHCNHPLYAAVKCRVCGRVTEPVQEPDNKADSIRWQLCLLAQTEEFSDEVRNQIARGVWLIDKLRAAPSPAEPAQEPVLTVDALRVEFECRYRGKLGITRVEGGAYLSPAIETEWQQFVRKHTAPPQRKPLTSDKDRPDNGATYVEGYGYVDTRAVRAIERAHKIGGEE